MSRQTEQRDVAADAPADRVVEATRRLPGLDGFRAIAAVMVLVFHVAGDTDFLRSGEPGAHVIDNFGSFGVAVFFVLSGLVIFRPFVLSGLKGTTAPHTPSFYLRRACRIFPAYWVALFAWAISSADIEHTKGTIIGKILLIDLYDPDVVWLTGLVISWTLAVEVVFYLLVPLWGWAMRAIARRGDARGHTIRVYLVGCGLLYLSGFAYRVIIDHTASGWATRWAVFPNFTDWFALGMLLAVLSAWRELGGAMPSWLTGFAGRPAGCWICAAACFAAIVFLKGDQLLFERHETTGQLAWRMMFQGWAAFFFVLPVVLGDASRASLRPFQARPLVFVGTVSYGVYLWHRIVQLWIGDVGSGLGSRGWMLVQLCLVLPITIAIATVSYRIVERPFIGMAARLTSSPRVSSRGSERLTPA
ncbi:MAG: acyltransferase family protein [Ilumatobacteraceae bacterium]